MKEIRNILFFKIGAIGDTLMTTPLVRRVRKAYPNAKIQYLIGQHSAPVLEESENIDEVVRFDESIFTDKKIKGWIGLISKIKKEKFDLIFVLDKHWIFNLTALMSRIPQRVGFNRNGKEGIFLTDKIYYGDIKHDIFCYLDLAKKFGLDIDYNEFKMDVFLSGKDRDFANKFWIENDLEDQKVVGICPGGGKNPGQVLNDKIWLVDNYIELIKNIDGTVLLLGGPSDKIKGNLILEQCANVVSAIGKSSIKQSIALMERCSIVICNDSGPMHMAAAVNKRIISIFGPVHPKRKAPLWKESNYLWGAEKIYDKNAETMGDFKSQNYFSNLGYKDILQILNRNNNERNGLKI